MTKNEVIEKIKLYEIPTEQLDNIDNRITQYVIDNLTNYDGHNKYEILAVLRFLDFLQREDLVLKKNEVKKFFTFYETLKFPSNKGMQSFKLTPNQCFIFANILGFYYKESGYRVCRDALLFCPRKWSKTTSVASLAIFDCLFGDADAQAYVASNSFAQSKICFDIIRNSLKALDPKLSHFRLNREIIYNLMANRTSFIRCLSTSADRLDGLNASVIINDEFAQADSADLKNVLTSSMGVRKNPLTVTITTASSKLESPFVAMLENYKKILEGEIDNDRVFSIIFQPDEEDDISDIKTWHKVQPHLGITVNEEFYRTEYQKALMSADDMMEFKTKLLNVFTKNTTEIWINKNIIEKNTEHFNFSMLKSRPQCMVSVDLSVKDDFSCVCYALYDSINKRFVFKNQYYIPKLTAENHPNRAMYQELIRNGYLIVCGSEVIDYKQIASDIISNSKYLNILQIGYDAYKSKEFINIIKAAGIRCATPYSQTYSNFTSPVESFELAVYEGRLKFDDNPLNAYCISNVMIDEDKMQNKKPIKRNRNDKIDGAICILMCLGMFQNYKR
ncbi:terminase large subunit [uncultured Bacteroides sp.]|jgi:phage terminase large subunit-like protein|uniref:terminase large subunit n=1 Tax=uncultured Bacteroides sp. TaxID=162156 RepID=UPI0008218250|nr:terminase TerL endonuclease subunit [uncultured Bacteroides sp.]SCH15661.1 Phage terminase-like protein%2C large subunit [uncultured Bacteroides sp.]